MALSLAAIFAGCPAAPPLEPLPPEPFADANAEARARLEAAAAKVRDAESRGAPRAERAAAWSELAQLAHAFQYFGTAQIAYRNAGSLAPDDGRWPYLEGLVASEAGDAVAALGAFDRALSRGSGGPAVRVAQARALAFLGRHPEASAAIAAALAATPDDAAALLAGAQIAADVGDAALAVARYERLLALQPEATKLWAPLSLLYRRLGRTAEADAALARHGDTPIAVSDPLLAAVRALAPGDADIAQRADLAARGGDLPKAEALFRQALAAAPASTEHRLNLAVVLLRQGRGREAIAELDRVLAIDPASGRAWFTRGVALVRAGDLEGGLAAYRRALEIDAGDAAARQNLANALLRAGRAREARAEYRTLLAHEPTSVPARLGLAASEAALGDFAAARRELERGFDRRTSAPAVSGALARVLAAAPDPAVRDGRRAVELARDAPELQSSPMALETLAMALAETGDLAGATSAQERALALARSTAAGDGLVRRLEGNLERYRRGQPCREPGLS